MTLTLVYNIVFLEVTFLPSLVIHSRSGVDILGLFVEVTFYGSLKSVIHSWLESWPDHVL